MCVCGCAGECVCRGVCVYVYMGVEGGIYVSVYV